MNKEKLCLYDYFKFRNSTQYLDIDGEYVLGMRSVLKFETPFDKYSKDCEWWVEHLFNSDSNVSDSTPIYFGLSMRDMFKILIENELLTEDEYLTHKKENTYLVVLKDSLENRIFIPENKIYIGVE